MLACIIAASWAIGIGAVQELDHADSSCCLATQASAPSFYAPCSESVKIPKKETHLFVAAGRARNLEAGRRHACQMVSVGSTPDHHRRPAACDWAVSRPWMRANLTGRSISGGGTAETCRISVSGRANGKGG